MTLGQPGSVEKSVHAKEPTGAMDLGRALALALLKNHELASFSWELRAREAEVLQAGLLPNPEAEVEADEFGGSKERKGYESAITRFDLIQLIELGGKRAKRVRVAELENSLAQWDYQAKRLDVIAATKEAWIRVLASQTRLDLAQTILKLTSKVREAVAQRVSAGKVSPMQLTKAEVTLAQAQVSVQRAERNLQAMRKELAAQWGNARPAFSQVQGNLETIAAIPPLSSLLERSNANPDIARWDEETTLQKAVIDSEEAKAIPDPTIRGGIARFEDTNENAFRVALSIPLPIFDRNQGGTLQARRRLRKVKELSRAARVEVSAELNSTYESLEAFRVQSKTIKEKILPSAASAFSATEEGYRVGKFGYLDMLDAERTLIQVRGQYIDSLEEYHLAKAKLERLIAEDFDSTLSGLGHVKETKDAQ